MKGGSTSRATPLQSSGSTVTNKLPSLSWTLGLKRSPTCSAEMGATGGSGCGCGVSTTCVHPPRTKQQECQAPFPMSASLRTVSQPTHSRRDRRSGGFYSHFCAHSSVWAKLKLAVAGGGGGRHFFQTTFGDSVFDAVGQLRARPGAGRIAAGLAGARQNRRSAATPRCSTAPTYGLAPASSRPLTRDRTGSRPKPIPTSGTARDPAAWPPAVPPPGLGRKPVPSTKSQPRLPQSPRCRGRARDRRLGARRRASASTGPAGRRPVRCVRSLTSSGRPSLSLPPAASDSPRPRRATSRWLRWCRSRSRSGRSYRA